MDKYACTVWHYIPMQCPAHSFRETPKLKRSLKSRAFTSNHPLKVRDNEASGLLGPPIHPVHSFPKTALPQISHCPSPDTSLWCLSHQHHAADQLMEEDSDRDRSMHCYRHGEQYRLAVSPLRKIPESVTARYDQLVKTKRSVNFSQGYLQKCQCIYYSVENQLFLFPAQDLFNKELHGSSFKMKDNLLYFAQEVLLNSRFALPFALLLAHPWKIELFSCVPSTRLLLQSLSVISIDCERPSRFLSVQECLFYCDEAGRAFKITTKPESYFSLFPTRPNTLASFSLKGSSFIHFFKNEGKIHSQSISHFFTKMCCDIKSLFLSHSHKHKIIARQHELYTLCDSLTGVTGEGVTGERVYSQSISVYSASKMEFLRSFSLSDILEQIPQQIEAHVVDLWAPSDSTYLLILLSSGYRAYLKTNPVKVLKVLAPPDLASLNSAPDAAKQRRVPHCRPNQQLHLNTSKIANQSLISIASSQGKAVTYLIHPSLKHKQDFYEEDVRKIDWHEPDLDCRDHFLYSCSIDSSFQGEMRTVGGGIRTQGGGMRTEGGGEMGIEVGGMKTEVGGFRWPNRRRVIGNEQPQPRRYIYATDLFLKMAVILRPIDTVLSIVSLCKCASKCVEAIRKILDIDTEAQIKQTLMLLLEIYTDSTGVYYSESKIQEQLKFAISDTARTKYDQLSSEKTVPNLTKKEYKKISRETMEMVWQTVVSLAGWTNKKIEGEIKGQTDGAMSRKMEGECLSSKAISQSCLLIFQKHLRAYRKRYLNDLKAEECQYLIQRGEQIRKAIARGGTGDKIVVLLTKCRQLLLLVSSVGSLPQLQLESALSQPYSYFHEAIFRCVMTNFDSQITQEMKDYFPLYIDHTLEHALQLCQALQREGRHLRNVELLRDYPNIPSYALIYLKEHHQVRPDLQNNFQDECVGFQDGCVGFQDECVGFQDECVGFPRPTALKSLPFVDGYEEALELIHSEETSLFEKQNIRDRQQERLRSYKRENAGDPLIPNYQATLDQLGRHIRMQSLIYIEYQAVLQSDAKVTLIRSILMKIVEAVSGDTQAQRDPTPPILNTYLLNPQKMLQLIHSLQSLRLQILFHLIIGQMPITEINSLFDQLDRQNQSSLLKFENELSYILRSTKGLLPPAKLLPQINGFLARNHPIDMMDYLQTRESISPKEFWVGVFLTERSMGVQEVIEAYRIELTRTFHRDERISAQQEYLFSLMNVFVLMENYRFTAESELAQLIEEQLCAREEEREVVGQLRLLLHSIRDRYS